MVPWSKKFAPPQQFLYALGIAQKAYWRPWLHLLRTASLVYIDSSFRDVPTSFYHLFTVSVPYAEHTFPVWFALMTRKTAALYEAVLQKVHEMVPEFQPTRIIVDFEEARIAAVWAVFWNDVAVSGCWFHFAQGLVKRIDVKKSSRKKINNVKKQKNKKMFVNVE